MKDEHIRLEGDKWKQMFYNEDGELCEEKHWKKSKIHGTWTHWYNGYKTSEQNWKNHALDGKSTTWDYVDGHKTSEIEWVDGLEHGKSIYYYPNGKKSVEAYFEDAILVGKLTIWYESGQKCKEFSYIEGKVNYSSNVELGILDGKRDGIWIWWHENGVKGLEQVFENDKPISRTEWDEDGNQTIQLNSEQLLKEEEEEYKRQQDAQLNHQFNPIEHSNAPLTDDEKLLGADFWRDVYGNDFIK